MSANLNSINNLIPILALCALPVLAVAQNTNVLRNPENQSFPGWTVYGPTYGPNLDTNVWSESGAAAHGGANYIEVSPGLTTYKINCSGLYQDYMSRPDATYSANGWVYAPSTNLLAGIPPPCSGPPSPVRATPLPNTTGELRKRLKLKNPTFVGVYKWRSP